MKAGSVGSNPNSTTISTPLPPLSEFLKHAGQAVFSLNTLVVGLHAVENGYDKPVTLDVSWDPVNRKDAARKSRKFVLEAVLVRMAEALKEHTVALSKLQRLSESATDLTADTSAAERVGTLGRKILGPESYLVPAVVLLVHWRNRMVHKNSKAALTPSEKAVLRKYENEIAENYKGLSVDRLLCHFEERRPTLKDISSLIAMSIRFARSIDKEISNNLGAYDPYLTTSPPIPIFRVSDGERKWRRNPPEKPIAKGSPSFR